MPIPVAVKASIILTPIIVAGGVALYETHKEDINTFVHNRIDDLREIAEELGLRQRRREAAGGYGGPTDDEALQRFLRRRRSTPRRTSRSRSPAKDDVELQNTARSTAVEDEESGLRRRGGDSDHPTVKQEQEEDPFADTAQLQRELEESAVPVTSPRRLSIPDTHAPSSSIPPTPSTLAIHTPTSEEDPMDFDYLESRSARSETSATDAGFSHIDSTGVRTPTSEGDDDLDRDAGMSTVSSWSAVSSRISEGEHH